jgi:hypothetical protein
MHCTRWLRKSRAASGHFRRWRAHKPQENLIRPRVLLSGIAALGGCDDDFWLMKHVRGRFDVSRMSLVFDRGMVSEDNLGLLETEGIKYIKAMDKSQVEKISAPIQDSERSPASPVPLISACFIPVRFHGFNPFVYAFIDERRIRRRIQSRAMQMWKTVGWHRKQKRAIPSCVRCNNWFAKVCCLVSMQRSPFHSWHEL